MTSSDLANSSLTRWFSNPPQTSLFIVDRHFNQEELIALIRDKLDVKQDNTTKIDPEMGVDAIRGARSLMMLKSGQDKRLFVLQDVDKMNAPSNNALLKSIEEPMEDSYMVLTATDKSRVLQTIRSRCRIVNLKSNKLIGEIDSEVIDLAKQYFTAKTIKRLALNKQIKDEQLEDFLKALLNINFHLLRRSDKSKLSSLINKQEVVLKCLESRSYHGNKKLLRNYLAVNL